MAEDLNFYITIDPNLPEVLDHPVLGFGSFRAKHPGALVYDSPNGENLANFYADLIYGRPMPLRLVTRSLTLSMLVVLALFLDRELALNPKVPELICSVAMAEGSGWVGLAHIDRDLARLFVFVEVYLFSEKPASTQILGQKVSIVLDWIGTWLRERRLPNLAKEPDPPQILDRGTNGFVVAQTIYPNQAMGMLELYRQGFLRGVVYSPLGEYTHVFAFRKSAYLQFDLEKAKSLLETTEEAMGFSSSWLLQEDCLKSGSNGTQLPIDALTQIFIRV